MNFKRFASLSAILMFLIWVSPQSQAQVTVQKRTLLQVTVDQERRGTPAQFSRDGSWFAYVVPSQGTTTFRMFDVRHSVQIASWNLRYLTEFAISPNGHEVATISGDRQRRGVGYGFAVEVRDIRTGAKKQTLVPTGSTNSAFYAVAWSEDGSQVAIGGGGGQVRLFNLRTAKQHNYAASGFIHALAFSPDGRFLAAGSEDDWGIHTSLSLWTLRTGRLGRLPNTDKLLGTFGLTFSDNSTQLFTRRMSGTSKGFVTVSYALPSLRPIGLIEPSPDDVGDFPSRQIVLSPHGDRFAFAGSTTILLGDTKTNRIIKRFQFATNIYDTDAYAVSFTPDGALRWVTSTFILSNPPDNTYRPTLWNAGKQ